MKTTTPATIDEYLATVSRDKRAALQRLRKTIRATIPRAEECINYGIPTFRLDGRGLVSFAAWAEHCAFYPGAIVNDLKAELEKYDLSKGTIRFPADKPLPVTLVRKLIKGRIAKVAARRVQRTRPAKLQRSPNRSNAARRAGARGSSAR